MANSQTNPGQMLAAGLLGIALGTLAGYTLGRAGPAPVVAQSPIPIPSQGQPPVPNSVPSLPPGASGSVKLYFSPGGGCTQAIVEEIRKARKSIAVQAYSFTSRPITQALVEAHQRGLEVRIVLDRSQQSARGSGAPILIQKNVPTRIDAQHAIAHNKIMELDEKTVLTGSFNFTKAAEESNAENLVILPDRPDLAGQFLKNFQRHWQHSEPMHLSAGHGEEP